MKYIKLFENYEEAIKAQNKKWNESLNSYAIWIPEMYKYWFSFQQDFIDKMSKLPFLDQIQSRDWGFGSDAKKLREYIRKYPDPKKLVDYFDKRNQRKEEIREILKDRYDDIFKGGATREESKLLEEQRKIQDELSDLHWIWTTCFKEHDFGIFYEIIEVAKDFADDENMEVYLAKVELFRGLQLKLVFAYENQEIKPSTSWNRATGEYTYTGLEMKGYFKSDDPIYDRAKVVDKRMQNYFLTVSMRPYGNMFILELSNQID